MARVLVVDDDADVLHLVWIQMRARGHLVLDVAMPAMDGLELLEQLRAATGIAELPAIFLPARVDHQTVEAAHRLGAAFLAKPFMEEILYAAIEAALAQGYEGLRTAGEEAEHRPPSR